MTVGTNLLKLAFRLWRTDGIPGTGANDPAKLEIQSALDALDLDIAAAGAGGDPDAVRAVIEPIRDEALDAATLAGQYANANTDADIPGAPAGDRGALYWAGRANAIANTATDTDVPGFAAGNRGARHWALLAQSLVGTVGASTQPTNEAAGTYQDDRGRWWMRFLRSGAVQVQKLLDATGRDIIALLDSVTGRTAALEAIVVNLPPIQRQRLKKALYYGQPRQVYAVDPITVAATANATAISSPVAIAKDDARIRFLSGRWVVGVAVPNNAYNTNYSILNGPIDGATGSNGLPPGGTAAQSAFEFTLPAGQAQVEVITRNQGASPYQMLIDIDGVGTNVNGYTQTSTFAPNYTLITFPASTSARVIRVTTISDKGLFGLNVQTGGTIGPKPVPARISSLAIMGDSISRGSNATNALNLYAQLVARRLGIDNVINVSMGGTGYIARFAFTYVSVTTTAGSPNVTVNAAGNFSLPAFSANPIPTTGILNTGSYVSDYLGQALQRDTKVVTGASGGGTAVLDKPATASATVLVRDETGRNFLDRIEDVLLAVMPDTGARATVTLNGTTSVAVTAGVLPTGAFVRAVGLQRISKVLVGAVAGGTAILDKAATGSASGVLADVGTPPDAVMIGGGVNDRSVAVGSAFFSLSDFSANVLALHQQLRAAAPDMEIFTLGTWSDTNNPSGSTQTFQTDATIKAAVDTIQRGHFMAVQGALTPANNATVFGGTGDGIHPGDAGHQIYADYVYPQIAAIINGY